MNYNREIERKFILGTDQTLQQVRRDVCALLSDPCPLDATSVDRFWKAPNVDFLRLRDDRQMTVKVTDKGDILDRVEENVSVDDVATCERLLTLVYGKPETLTKTYSVWSVVEGVAADIREISVVCVYQVRGDSRVFLEVEADDMEAVDETTEYLKKYLDLVPEHRSLYQIFILKERE